MAKKRHKLRHDLNEVAFRIVQAATGEGPRPEPPGVGEKNPEAVKRGRKGGTKGGRARADTLSAADRKRIAKKAAISRWREAE